VRTDQRESKHSFTLVGEGERWENHVITGHGDVALADHPTRHAAVAEMRLDAEPSDTSATPVADYRIYSRVEHTVGIDDLVHPIVVGVDELLRFAERSTQRYRTCLLCCRVGLPIGFGR